MNVQTQIDNLIVNLQHLKTSIATLDGSDPTGFIQEFEKSLAQLEQDFSPSQGPQRSTESPAAAQPIAVVATDPVPEWFDLNNPKRPSSMQLMEIMTGKSREEIFQLDNFKAISREASDLLYGVLGSKADLRDWAKIMTSGSIVAEIKNQNAKLLNPMVDVKNTFSNMGDPFLSEIIIKDGEGNDLRRVKGDSQELTQVLENFGVTPSSLTRDLEGYALSNIEATTRELLQQFMT